MNNKLFALGLLLVANTSFAQPSNLNGQKFEELEQIVQGLEQSNATLRDQVEVLEAESTETKSKLDALETLVLELSNGDGSGSANDFVFVGVSEEAFTYPPTDLSGFLVGACQAVFGSGSRLATSKEVMESTVAPPVGEKFFVRGNYSSGSWSGTGSAIRTEGFLWETNLAGLLKYSGGPSQTPAPVILTDGLTASILSRTTTVTDARKVGCAARL